MKLSSIGWCDYSSGDLNFVRGCAPVSEGCTNCYARAIYERFGKDFSKVVCDEAALMRLRLAKFPKFSPKRGAPHKPVAFVCDTGDLFHPDVPADFATLVFEVLSYHRNVEWVVLTKRIERAREVLFGQEGNWFLGGGDYFPNIRLMVTAENQARFDERVPILLDCWEGPNGVSIEPMLGPVDVAEKLTCNGTKVNGECCESYAVYGHHFHGLDLVIAGAESGPKRRSFDVAWAEDVKAQCDAAGVSFFGKQDSGLRPGTPLLIEGREWKAWPKEEK